MPISMVLFSSVENWISEFIIAVVLNEMKNPQTFGRINIDAEQILWFQAIRFLAMLRMLNCRKHAIA